MTSKARILLLCDDRRGNANTILDHINAFRRYSSHQVRTFNPKAMRRIHALNLDDFDVVVVHYSVVLSDPFFISPEVMAKLKRFQGLKIEFIQDDYRWVNRAAAAAREMGIDVLFTVAPEPAAGLLYDKLLPGVRRVQTLTGYVPDNLLGRAVVPLAERPIEVGYRAREPAFWLGRLSQEKIWIGEKFLEHSSQFGLRSDVAWKEHDRIYGEDWIKFISSCRAMLGSESGASIADFDGSAESAVRTYLRAHPGAPFDEVHDAVLRPYEGNVIVNVVSPRVFEAAALKTALINFPGEYSGVIAPGRNYIVLEKDFSNMKDVVAQLRDDELVSAMAEQTYQDLIESGRYTYESFIKEFDAVIDAEARSMRGRSVALRWRLAGAERAIQVPGMRVRLLRAAQKVWTRVRGRDQTIGFPIDYESQVEKGLMTLGILLREPDLRPIFRLGRRNGVPLDRLLREVMELSLLRRAADGGVERDQQFTVTIEFDEGRNAACFVSVPVGQRAGSDDHDMRERLRTAIRDRDLATLEWDHRALGGLLHLTRPTMDVGIGFDGLESFSAIMGVGRQHPEALERALKPLLDREAEGVPVG